jgi:hypothetical protein
MARRLWALVVVLVIVGTPVAVIVCDATCTSHETHGMMSAYGHRHADHSSARPDGVTVNAAPQRCNHPADVTVAVQRTLESLTAPAVVAVQVLGRQPDVDPIISSRLSVIEYSPPGLLARATHLRV